MWFADSGRFSPSLRAVRRQVVDVGLVAPSPPCPIGIHHLKHCENINTKSIKNGKETRTSLKRGFRRFFQHRKRKEKEGNFP